MRKELGDKLYVRAGGVIELTPGGRRLASAASDILGLADGAREAIRDGDGERTTVRVAATPPFAEFAAGPLLSVFSHRHDDIEVDLQVARREDFAALLANRTVDITLGPPVTDRQDVPAMVSEAFLRYGLIVVASPGHTLAASKGLAPAALVSTPWLLGPYENERSTDTGAFLARQSIAPRRTRAYPNFAAALAQVASGRGVTLALAHTVRDELERGSLVELDVRGTPISGLWYVSSLRPGAAHLGGGGAAPLRHDAGGDARHARPGRRRPRRALRPHGDALELTAPGALRPALRQPAAASSSSFFSAWYVEAALWASFSQ